MDIIKADRTQTTVREIEYDNEGRVVKETTTVTSETNETQNQGK